MLLSKPRNIILHSVAWLLFFSLVIAFVSESPGEDVMSRVLSSSFLIFCGVYLFIFYFNAYFLFPRLYLSRNYLIYFTIIIILLIVVILLAPFDNMMGRIHQSNGPGIMQLPPPGGLHQNHPIDFTSIVLFLAAWSLSTAICITLRLRLTESRAAKAEADKANAELSFLKAQINPHFLFNTLNNIYSLALTKNENTAASIMKLSNIMRYVMDETKENYISLQNEIECMTDYIDLQRLRLGKNMNVQLSVTGDTVAKKIAPMVLMTFVENVFKYGISNNEPSAILIKLAADEDTITFFCQNRLFNQPVNAGSAGIGIENTRQRLQRLYANRHFLNINTENGLYTVQLSLQV